MISFLFSLVALVAPPLAPEPVKLVDPKSLDGDFAVKAMREEMARTMSRLRLENSDPPFIVEYTLNSQKAFVVNASFGALTNDGDNVNRSVTVGIRVGDYTMDNTNFAGGFGGSTARTGVPKDDDYETVRHNLWLATDEAYKGAVEQMAQKKAWLKTNTVKDHPGDLTKVAPTVHIEPERTLVVDKEKAKEIARKLSGLFRDAPKIQGSSVSVVAVAGNDLTISSEGFFYRKGETFARVTVTAGTQADDGMPLGDLCVFYAPSADKLPSLESMEKDVKAMIDRLSGQTSAPRADEYVGPVLFEGDAAAFCMMELLVDRLTNPHEPLGAKNSGTPFKNRLKKRVAPAFLSVVDDPSQTEWNGTPLMGSFSLDDDGVPPQAITLIDEGRLKNWYMSRIPTRMIKDTNGHSKNGVGGPGCVFVKSTNSMSKEKLRAELLRIAKEQELPYAIRVETLARADVQVSGRSASGAYGNGNIRLSPPIAAYRVYLDGHEELIRGAEWQGVTLRTLRDIDYTGDTPHVLNALRGSGFVSVVCPDILVEEIEVKKPAEQEVKRPYLEHPYFAKP